MFWSSTAEIRTIAARARTVPAARFVTGLQDLIAAPSSIIELSVRRPCICLGEFVPNGIVFIAHAPSVMGIVLPFVEVPIDIDVAVDVDVPIYVDVDIAVIPIDIVPDLAADCVGCAPRQPGRDCAANDVA